MSRDVVGELREKYEAADVQRYELERDPRRGDAMEPDPDGNWVRHSDYLLALAKLAVVEGERAELWNNNRAMLISFAVAIGLPVPKEDEPLPDFYLLRVLAAMRDYAKERDSALTRAEQSEALLREALPFVSPVSHQGPTADELRAEYPEACALVDGLRDRIQAHLAPKETT